MVEHTTALLTLLSTLLPQDPAPAARQDGAAPTADPLLGTVGKREIRLSHLIEEVNRQIPLNYYHRRVPAEKMAEFQREAFDLIVVKHLIHQDALDTGLEATDEEVRAEFEAALREAGGHYTSLQPRAKEALLAEVRPTVVRRILIRKNEERVAAKVPKADDKMVREIYDERIEADETAFMAPREAHFRHIFVKVDPSRIRREEAPKKAVIEEALAEIRKGRPFAEVARIYSEDEYAGNGGDIGYQKEGSFRMKSLNEHAFVLQAGETSEVIRSLHGFHLLHCVDVVPPRRHTYEEMRPAIEDWLQEEHLKIARGRWLAGLRERYPVEILRPDLLETPGGEGSGTPDAGKKDGKGDGK